MHMCSCEGEWVRAETWGMCVSVCVFFVVVFF